MFKRSAAVFFYALSPVHMGVGRAVDFVDNPIQRERHTGHPCFAGSGLKGALRHSFASLGGDKDHIDRLFGPDSNSKDLYAGAISFGDAQLLALPVRSLRGSFVYATCPVALARTRRLLAHIGTPLQWAIPSVAEQTCITLQDRCLADDGQLHLEAFEYRASDKANAGLQVIAQDIAKMALPAGAGYDYFRAKLQQDLVLLSDSDFNHFSQYAMLVEPHVRVDEETGTAQAGGFFYTENLPPESLLVAPLMVGDTRAQQDPLSADQVFDHICKVLQHQLLQIGGDATTGRGLVATTVVAEPITLRS